MVPYLTPSNGECVSYQPLPNTVAIGNASTLDFSGFRHFIAMPDLRSFANAGFPFSRLADLSQTLVVVAPKPSAIQVSTLLSALGNIGAQTGYPALAVTLSDDVAQAQDKDRDILLIGRIPPTLRDADRVAALVSATQSWLESPMNTTTDNTIPDPSATRAAAKRPSARRRRWPPSSVFSRHSMRSVAWSRCWRTISRAIHCLITP